MIVGDVMMHMVMVTKVKANSSLIILVIWL